MDDAVTDAALDRDLEAALAVDPSPELVARVRMRVQRERDASWSPWPWGLAAGAGAIVVLVAVIVVVGMERAGGSRIAQDSSPALRRSPVPLDSSPVPVAPDSSRVPVAQDSSRVPVAQDVSPAPASPRRVVAPSARRSAPRNAPEVLFAADEARAQRRQIADIQKGHIDQSLQEGPPATAALQPPGEIAFPPITFEPIVTSTAESTEEGERQ
jgi:hypothetical protein